MSAHAHHAQQFVQHRKPVLTYTPQCTSLDQVVTVSRIRMIPGSARLCSVSTLFFSDRVMTPPESRRRLFIYPRRDYIHTCVRATAEMPPPVTPPVTASAGNSPLSSGLWKNFGGTSRNGCLILLIVFRDMRCKHVSNSSWMHIKCNGWEPWLIQC